MMVAERWNSSVDQFIRNFIVESSSQVVVLANQLEAVIYGKLKIVPPFLTDSSDKLTSLENLGLGEG